VLAAAAKRILEAVTGRLFCYQVQRMPYSVSSAGCLTVQLILARPSLPIRTGNLSVKRPESIDK
jgi:hypothetical protein